MTSTRVHRNFENTNLDKYELIDFPLEQLGDLSQEHMGIEAAFTMDTGIARRAGILLGEFSGIALGVDPCHGSSLSSPYK